MRTFTKSPLQVVVPLSLLLVGLPTLAGAEPAPPGTGILRGVVLAASGAVARDAVVEIPDLRRRVAVDAEGRFTFADLPGGEVLLVATSPRAGAWTGRVSVTEGTPVELTVTLALEVHQDEIVVTATGATRGLGELAQAADVLADEQLLGRLQPTLGETLASQPGVSSTYFGPGASRPVIRGLGGGRVRVLEGGVGSGDASDTSPDHAVSNNPFSAERLEILRGPATLLYGSAASGGVVNVIDDRVPDFVPEEPVSGRVTALGGTVAEERSGGIRLAGRLSDRLAWHLDGFRRQTDDLEIPGHAEAPRQEAGEHDEEEGAEKALFGVLANSAVEAEGGSVGLAWVGDAGFVGVAYTLYDTLYGVPGHAHEHEEGLAEHRTRARFGQFEDEEQEEEGAVRIDLAQRRIDLRGELDAELGVFRGLKVRLGRTDYEHQELEGEEIGTLFTNDSWELRLEAPHRRLGSVEGSLGLQVLDRDFEAIGEEAFVPPTETRGYALFLFEEVDRGPVELQLGLRYETQDVDSRTLQPASRSHSGVSASLGMVWELDTAWTLAGSLARGVKLPNAEELYAGGPHIATRAFEVGDPSLDEESSVGVDLALRRTDGPIRGSLNLFATRYDGFIIDVPTGEEEDGLPVFRFVGRDADFRGFELEVHCELLHRDLHHLELQLMADYVRAEDRASGDPLPRIPPLRYGVALRYRGGVWSAAVEGRRVDAQDRLAAFETSTAGYTLLNAELGYRFFAGPTVHDLLLRGTNLSDEEARNHTSFLKDLAPLPGRDISMVYQVSF